MKTSSARHGTHDRALTINIRKINIIADENQIPGLDYSLHQLYNLEKHPQNYKKCGSKSK